MSIVGALRAGTEQVQFISGAKLLDLFKQYWPEFLAGQFKLIQTYADNLVNATGKTKELTATFHSNTSWLPLRRASSECTCNLSFIGLLGHIPCNRLTRQSLGLFAARFALRR